MSDGHDSGKAPPIPDASDEAAFLKSGDFDCIESVAGIQIAGLASEGFYLEDELEELLTRGRLGDVLNKDERGHFLKVAHDRSDGAGNLGKFERTLERYKEQAPEPLTSDQLEMIRNVAGPRIARIVADGGLIDEVPTLLTRAEEMRPLDPQEVADLLAKAFERERQTRGNTNRLQAILNGQIAPDESVDRRAVGLSMQKEDVERLEAVVGPTASDLIQHLFPQMNQRQQREFVLDPLADGLPCTQDEFVDLICEEFKLAARPQRGDAADPLDGMIIQFHGVDGIDDTRVYPARRTPDQPPEAGGQDEPVDEASEFQQALAALINDERQADEAPYASEGDNPLGAEESDSDMSGSASPASAGAVSDDPGGSSKLLPHPTRGYGIDTEGGSRREMKDIPPLPPVRSGSFSRAHRATLSTEIGSPVTPPKPPVPPTRPAPANASSVESGPAPEIKPLPGTPGISPRLTGRKSGPLAVPNLDDEVGLSSRAPGADDSARVDIPAFGGASDEEEVATASHAAGSNASSSWMDDAAESELFGGGDIALSERAPGESSRAPDFAPDESHPELFDRAPGDSSRAAGALPAEDLTLSSHAPKGPGESHGSKAGSEEVIVDDPTFRSHAPGASGSRRNPALTRDDADDESDPLFGSRADDSASADESGSAEPGGSSDSRRLRHSLAGTGERSASGGSAPLDDHDGTPFPPFSRRRGGRGDTRVDETEPDLEPVSLPSREPDPASPSVASAAPTPPPRRRRFLKYAALSVFAVYVLLTAAYLYVDHKIVHVPKRYPNEWSMAAISSFTTGIMTPDAPATEQQILALSTLSPGPLRLLNAPVRPVSGGDGEVSFNLEVASSLKRFVHPGDVGRIYYDLRHVPGNEGLLLTGLYSYVQEDGKLALLVRFENRRPEIEDVDKNKIHFTICETMR